MNQGSYQLFGQSDKPHLAGLCGARKLAHSKAGMVVPSYGETVTFT